MQVLYAYELNGYPIDEVMDDLLSDLDNEALTVKFAKALIKKTAEERENLDTLIKKRVTNWEFKRLAIIDRIVLRIGVCELLYFEDIPPKVSINEAIEIARRFSTEKSDKFVNGVLDSILDDLIKEGRLVKTGRGLVTLSSKKKKSDAVS
jgi:N utilization substance protein B